MAPKLIMVGERRKARSPVEQVKLRGRHCTGVIVNHVAQAMLAGQLDPDDEAVLQRSAEYNTGGDPITADECARWDHPTVSMLLMGDLYAPEYGRFEPPIGNVKLLWPGRVFKLTTATRFSSSVARRSKQVQGTWTATARGYDEVFTGVVQVMVAEPTYLTNLIRDFFNLD